MSVSGIVRLIVLDGGAHKGLAEQIARVLKAPLGAVTIGAFADGESRVSVQADLRGVTAVIVQPTGPPVNDNLMALALLAEAAHGAGAPRVVAVVPYFGYARQDVRAARGDPRSARLVGALLASAGVNHLITLDLHTPALESALPMPATLLRPDDLFVPHIRQWGLHDLVVVTPDAGGFKRAQRFALALNADVAAIAKVRPRPDEAVSVQVLGEVRGRPCLVVDDMASTGRTLRGAADALRGAGAREVSAVFTHPVLAPGSPGLIQDAHFSKVITSDSIPPMTGEWLEVVPTANLFANAVIEACSMATTPLADG